MSKTLGSDPTRKVLTENQVTAMIAVRDLNAEVQDLAEARKDAEAKEKEKKKKLAEAEVKLAKALNGATRCVTKIGDTIIRVDYEVKHTPAKEPTHVNYYRDNPAKTTYKLILEEEEDS